MLWAVAFCAVPVDTPPPTLIDPPASSARRFREKETLKSVSAWRRMKHTQTE